MTAHSAEAAVVTVVVVDDSAVQRRFVRSALADDPCIEVIGEARNGRDAVALVERLQPSAVLMDLHLPVMNGIEAIERIMAVRPTPIVVYSAFVDGDDRENATGAIAAGAIDVMAKPGADQTDLTACAAALRQRLRVAGRVRVITHPRARLGGSTTQVSTWRLGGGVPRPRAGLNAVPAGSSTASSASDGGPAAAATVGAGAEAAATSARLLANLPGELPQVDVLAIGASTGGPQALATVLSAFPATTGVAVVVVQHMADGFMEGLAGWLDQLCPLPVAVGESGHRLRAGTVTVAPSGLNFLVHDTLRVTTHRPPATQYHVPGIDATFASLATSLGSRAAGVLLTGMGRDGAAGLKALRHTGGFTVAQDESTSAVYGMPAAAMALDAAVVQLGLPDVAELTRRLLTTKAGERA